MYNVEKLEQQWMRYRRKKIIFPVMVFFLGFLIIAAAVYFVGTKEHVSDNNTSMLASAKKAQVSSALRPGGETDKKRPVGKLDILSTGVPSLSSNQDKERPKVGQIIFQDTVTKPTNKPAKRKNILIQVRERGGKDIAVDIENRFEFAKDKSDSLFLAKYYYDKMDYSKSEKWALETNKLDNTIEEGWLIFAKSLAKKGKRIESLKVLKTFLDSSDSPKAKNLMDKIRRGKSF